MSIPVPKYKLYDRKDIEVLGHIFCTRSAVSQKTSLCDARSTTIL